MQRRAREGGGNKQGPNRRSKHAGCYVVGMTTSTLLLAALAAMGTGLILGLIGGGGSVLTVPVFVYLLGYPAKQAIAMSLPIIGCASLVGALGHWRAGHVQWRTALAFGAVAMFGSFIGARLSTLLDGRLQLVLLASAMSIASTSMLRSAAKGAPAATTPQRSLPLVALAGVGVGVLTGLVGVGGGFLIVPSLVVLGGVPMRAAIGTSLAIITMNTLSGFAGYVGRVAFDWTTMIMFTAIAIVGILIGTRLAPRVPVERLKQGFALFLLAVAGVILFQNRSVLVGH